MTHFERSPACRTGREKKGSERSEGSYFERSEKKGSQAIARGSYSFKILPHPSDVKLQITASTKEELFQGALAGMASIIDTELSKKAQIVKENIKVESLDFDTLLVDFLSEVLAKTDISHAVFNKLKIKKLTDSSLQTEIKGQKSDYFGQEIKAVTHHGLKIKQDKSGNYEVTILFDI